MEWSWPSYFIGAGCGALLIIAVIVTAVCIIAGAGLETWDISD